MLETRPHRWLLLIHQIPPKPAYLRVKAGRRLARIGAVALKSTVYVLPSSENATEDFQWVRREIVEGGGDATIAEAQLVDGLSDFEVEGLFRAARGQDYAEILRDLRSIEARDETAETDLERVERRFAEITAIDFFGAEGSDTVSSLIRELRDRLRAPESATTSEARDEKPRGRTWVTRTGVHIDRIASAWLVRRFIDPDAVFKFVPAKGYVPLSGELRFDMFDAEYTHEGDRCTFETLCTHFDLRQRGLDAIAEVVHDIDVKDGKFGRAETEGVAAIVVGIAAEERDDEKRLERGFRIFDALVAFYARSKKARGNA